MRSCVHDVLRQDTEPAWQQGSVDDVGAGRAEVLGVWSDIGKSLGDQWCQGGYGSADRGLGDSEGLGDIVLATVAAEVDECGFQAVS